MFPGGRMNPRQMRQMMKRLGIQSEDIEDVEEIVIRTPTKEYRFGRAQVTMMTVQGQKTFQIVGEPEVVERGEGGREAIAIPDEDVRLVAEKAGATEEDARRALEECGGEPAEAIIRLMSR
jgi:nascent polypeptide-associated complex subunit alpha